MTQEQSRREFVAMSAALGLAAAARARAAESDVRESSLNIKTPDGDCDASFYHPASGSHPGVVFWCDAFGLRPVTQAMGRRLAAEGYSVLVPNPFYRVAKAPVVEDASTLSFGNPADREKLQKWMGSISAPGNAERDAVAFIDFLDAQSVVDKGRKIGTQGYCMGGPLVMKTCAVRPDRVGAGGSFHGGGLVTDAPTSPHLLIPKMKAQLYFGIAANDDARQPDAKDVLRKACMDAGLKAEIQVYPGSQHGWCMADMPKGEGGKPIYNEQDAERAWGKLLALYKSALG